MSNFIRKTTIMATSVIAILGSALIPCCAQSSTSRGSSAKAETSVSAAPFAFIELFTSEGCSSCPSADQNLERIARNAAATGKNVVTLSYHVDYWNRLGWKDPYSSAEFTQRQRRYANKFDSSRIYTPQMIVNGRAEFVGSKRDKSDNVVSFALRVKPTAAIKVQAGFNGKQVKATWRAMGLDSGDAVRVALVQKTGEQKVTRGENARRKLTHVNIVRQLKSQSRPSDRGQMLFDVPSGFDSADFHVVAFIESAKNGVTSVATGEFNDSARTKTSSWSIGQLRSESYYAKVGPSQKSKLLPIDGFLDMLIGQRQFNANLDAASKNWNAAYAPMLLEVGRFLPLSAQSRIFAVLEKNTGQEFGVNFDRWLQWNWGEKFEPHPEYSRFKSELYSKVDPRFAEYFENSENPKIRLDEIRWGGVRRDGIPPLKNPKMVSAKQADYLSDSDVVFGIDLNGDARCYPKRILAWREMFKDTIGGESVCGVY